MSMTSWFRSSELAQYLGELQLNICVNRGQSSSFPTIFAYKAYCNQPSCTHDKDELLSAAKLRSSSPERQKDQS